MINFYKSTSEAGSHPLQGSTGTTSGSFKKACIRTGLTLMFIFCLGFQTAFAHAVQVGYTILSNGFIRVYIEHWHGALSADDLRGNGMNITTTYGNTSVTQDVDPSGAFNGYAWNQLPGAEGNIRILSTSSSANFYSNWAYYDFAPAACNVPLNITLNGGLTVVLTEAEDSIWPQTISGTFNDTSGPVITPTNNNVFVPCGTPGANVNFSSKVIDNCTQNVTATYSIQPGSYFPVGTTNVTAYSTDANGNSTTFTFPVTVAISGDIDGDGVTSCAGDCNDNDATIYPGAPEICDGKDNNCDGVIPANEIDRDGDGYSVCQGDCNDTDANVHPGAVEICGNGIDDNCDGKIDFIDNDGDGYNGCTSDLNDNDATIYPGAPELCDGKDNNLDGVIPSNEIDLDGDGYSVCQGDCNDANAGIHPGATEIIGNRIDDNCDGLVDIIPYATPSVGLPCYYMWMTNVTLEAINNSTGCNGYSDYTAISTALTPGSSYSISLSGSGSYDQYGSVFIDYNKDGDFDDEGELAVSYIYMPYYDSGYGTFTAPSTASGSYRMRVVSDYVGSYDPNGSLYSNYGEIEDYTLVIGSSVNQASVVFNTPPTPLGGTNIFVRSGDNINQTIQASDPDPADRVSITSASLPNGATLSPLPTATGNPVTSQLTWVPQAFNWGINAVSITASDSYGAQTVHNFTYTVNTIPSFISTAPTGEAKAGELYSYTIQVSEPDLPYGDRLEITAASLPAWLTLVDNHDGTATLSGTPASADAGTYTIHLHAEDIYHNNYSNHVSQKVKIIVPACNTVLASTSVSPTCSASNDGSVDLVVSGGKAPFIYSWSNGATTEDLSNVVAGEYTVTVVDANNCSAILAVSVIANPDVQAPVAPVLADVTGECSATSTVPTAKDNCSGTITGTTTDATSYSAQGIHVITWTFTDAAGNASTATQNVIVKDVTAPALPELATIKGECSATAVAPTTTDNCAGTVTGTTNDPLTYTAQGSYVIHWTFNDGNGNVTTAEQNVIVKDITAPVKPVLANVTSECSATVKAPTTTDNCAGTITGKTSDYTTYATQGTYVIHWTFNDGNGNVTTAEQKVIIKDVTAPGKPVLTDVKGECSATASVASTTDNCAGTVIGTTNDPLIYTAQGSYVIHWTFNDGNGNITTADQNVIVKDVTPPTVITRNISATLVNGSVTVTAAQINNGSFDNCGPVTISLPSTTFVCGQYGPQTVTLTVKDANGLSSTGTATVTVVGETPTPLIAVSRTDVTNTGLSANTIALGYGAQSLTLAASNGGKSANYKWSPATGLSSTTSAAPVFTPTSAGTYVFTVEATNQYGCKASTSVTITVVDVRCGNKNDKVVVCHKTGSVKNPTEELCIAPSAVATHLAHGDNIGACGSTSTKLADVVSNDKVELPEMNSTVSATTKLTAYPNPFISSTTVEFTLAADQANVTLAVYDSKGAKVKTLYTGSAVAGKAYSYTFSGSYSAYETYYFKLVTPNEVLNFQAIMAK